MAKKTMPRRANVTKVETQHFAVTGSGRFPIDMLRYDNAVPVSEGDSHKIEHKGLRTIALKRFGVPGSRGPSPRWVSFGWVVTRVNEE